jgi:hypothetical protein
LSSQPFSALALLFGAFSAGQQEAAIQITPAQPTRLFFSKTPSHNVKDSPTFARW